jgi:hypothetical protein
LSRSSLTIAAEMFAMARPFDPLKESPTLEERRAIAEC